MKFALLFVLSLPGFALAKTPTFECKILRALSMTEIDCAGANATCKQETEDDMTIFSMENTEIKAELIYLKDFPFRVFLTHKASGFYSMAPAASDYATTTLGTPTTNYELRCWMK